MKKLLRSLAIAGALIAGSVSAFGQAQLPSGYLMGNSGATTGVARPDSLTNYLNRIMGSTSDRSIYRDGSSWTTYTITSFGRSMLDDANAGAVLTTLGVSAFAQTMLDDADAAAVRATIGVGTGTGDVISSANLSDLANTDTGRTNLDAVGYNVDAGRSTAEKLQARANIDGFMRTLATPVTLTNQTQVTFGSIPAGTFKIEMYFSALSMNGSDSPIVEIGDAGGIETTGYSGSTIFTPSGSATTGAGWSIGATITTVAATNVIHGKVVYDLLDASTNTWTITVHASLSDTNFSFLGAGTKSLSATLTQIRLNTAGGATQFDAGKVNVRYFHP